MSRYFVTDPPVAVHEPGEPANGNVIWIRPRMDVETRGKVSSALATIGEDGKTPIMQAGAQQTALLLYNIVRWEGPDLSAVPCTPANIRKLDPTEPHIIRVLDEIGRRNAPRESPSPKSLAGNGSLSAGSRASNPPAPAGLTGHQLATTIAMSSSPSASGGRHDKSENSIPTS